MTTPSIDFATPATGVYTRNLGIGPFVIPGVGAAAAYAAADQFGILFQIPAFQRGIIRELRFHDLDNEGIDKELILFRRSVTLAADNAAFTLGDVDNLAIIGFFTISTWVVLGSTSQIGHSQNVPAQYDLGDGNTTIWGAFRTKGTDNIALGSEPQLSLVIERMGPR